MAIDCPGDYRAALLLRLLLSLVSCGGREEDSFKRWPVVGCEVNCVFPWFKRIIWSLINIVPGGPLLMIIMMMMVSQ